ncbi:hypothetical protein PF005_g13923 [Phytophthora fragariae]|uniref:V-type proton ATPase proteolipid subunit n=2 Tax=Phytophthora TaxID=4783 RepID=A0A6A3RLC8_9STRA|nr:hypothetical protein PF003_g8917 [Phytophthora fragariae]KAE8933023.1 hypothetical protein PF009_g16962 [Phytophthora fragariae]KAE9000389.1 hypothetical protein PF011_g14201 [Phytophthora fragariae]KAE9099125.1 hypothetical protein PF007_g16000 [Phytophthora fragariae]KAE9102859.1 hypothetical protein PF010_g13963 [Phytophthora fragariae]
MGVMRPDLAMRNIIPVVMTGVLDIYELIAAVIIQGSIDHPSDNAPKYGSYTGFAHLAASLCCGLSSLRPAWPSAWWTTQACAPWARILILIFAEALGLYGLIVALILSQKKSDCPSE